MEMKRSFRRRRARGTTRFARLGVLALAASLATTSCDAGRAENGGAGDAGGPGGAGSVAAGSVATADTALARMMEGLLPRVERSAGIAATRPPRLARADRDRLRTYLEEQLRLQLPPEEARRITAAYARFGLLPDTLDLSELLAGLYQEQVVGYYDPKTDTLFVLEDVPTAQLETVLSHELVHALQDQHVDLDSLMEAVRDDNDAATAAQAAIEGHATLAMLELQLAGLAGREVDVEELPSLGEQLEAMGMDQLAEAGGLPALGRAPRVIREALVFPYIGGLSFVQRLWQERPGRPAPFGRDLPASTEQVLHPERFVGEDRDEPTSLTFAAPPPEGWEEVHADGLGELEMRIFLEEHLAGEDGDSEAAAGTSAAARAAARGWDGDVYRLLRGPEGEVLVWTTVWDDAAEADEFAEAARRAWERRYEGDRTRRVRVERGTEGGRETVLILDLPGDLDRDPGWEAARVELGSS